jgi:hypothetical protein
VIGLDDLMTVSSRIILSTKRVLGSSSTTRIVLNVLEDPQSLTGLPGMAHTLGQGA